MMHVKTYADLGRDVMKLVPWCLEREVPAVYGVPRSGLLPATMLAAALQVPVGVPGAGDFAGRRVVTRPRTGLGGRPLLLDDSVNNGNAMKTSAAIMGLDAVWRGAVYTKPASIPLVDVVAEVLDGPRFFQWNLFNCDAGQFFMVDMDGVLCRDPTPFDDDGPEYAAALVDAIPFHVSTWPLGWIATNRLGRWRDITKNWLARHGIAVEGVLYMREFRTAAERRRASASPAEFKAECYTKHPSARLFVESHEAQAKEIHARTRRPVLAVDTWKLYQEATR